MNVRVSQIPAAVELGQLFYIRTWMFPGFARCFQTDGDRTRLTTSYQVLTLPSLIIMLPYQRLWFTLNRFFLVFFGGGVRLSPLGTSTNNWPIVPAPDNR
jgi:hypothetical protein